MTIWGINEKHYEGDCCITDRVQIWLILRLSTCTDSVYLRQDTRLFADHHVFFGAVDTSIREQTTPVVVADSRKKIRRSRWPPAAAPIVSLELSSLFGRDKLEKLWSSIHGKY